jgi:hypothetical protein
VKRLSLLSAMLMASPAIAATHTTVIDAATYGVTGTIVFNDHDYVGPAGVGANDFKVGSGFDANRIGQIQDVVTKNPDGLTSDAPMTVRGDFSNNPNYPRANMDGQVSFYKWAYTTVGGSTFHNMTIDKAGNYFVAKNDMAFKYYDTFQYHDEGGINPDSTRDTLLNFQPYAISDARGWCGSVLTSSPNSLERMAGQVTFDFAFDVYFDGITKPDGKDVYSGTQIIPDFVMRSYGDYTMDVNGIHYSGSAVENNTNPLTGQLDPLWQNQVSFLGGGVIPKGIWVFNDGTHDVTVAEVQGVAGTAGGQSRADGATWHANSFAGYGFLLRADGTRTLTFAATDWSDYSAAAVPEPSTYAMMAVGLGMLGAVARRRTIIASRAADFSRAV